MKLIIAGSRTIKTLCPYWFRDTLANFGINCQVDSNDITEIVSGTAGGVDTLGEKFASKYILRVKRFPADWDNKGKAAGFIRNAEMAKYADALLLVWDGKSRGSANMKVQMEKLNKPIYEVILK